MSTAKLREALDYLENYLDSNDEAQAARREARKELEALEKAARDLDRLSIGDFTYNIRDREQTMSETPDGQNTWEHPDVKAWSDASSLMAAIARQAEEKKR